MNTFYKLLSIFTVIFFMGIKPDFAADNFDSNPLTNVEVVIDQYALPEGFNAESLVGVAEVAARAAHAPYVAEGNAKPWEQLDQSEQQGNIALQLQYLRIMATPGLTRDEQAALVHNEWVVQTGLKKLAKAKAAYEAALAAGGAEQIADTQKAFDTRTAQTKPYIQLPTPEQDKDFGQLDAAKNAILNDNTEASGSAANSCHVKLKAMIITQAK